MAARAKYLKRILFTVSSARKPEFFNIATIYRNF